MAQNVRFMPNNWCVDIISLTWKTEEITKNSRKKIEGLASGHVILWERATSCIFNCLTTAHAHL